MSEEELSYAWQSTPELGVMCTCAQFNSDGEYLVAGCSDGTVAVYNAAGKILHKKGVHIKQDGSLSSMLQDTGKGAVSAIKFNPRSKEKFRVANSDGSVELFNAKNGSSMGGIKAEDGRESNALDYSPDGEKFAVGGKEKLEPGEQWQAVRLVDETSNKVIREMRGTAQAAGHSNKIQCVKFKTANMLATGSMDGTVKIWSTGGPEPILSLPMAAPAAPYPIEAKAADGTFDTPSLDFRDNLLLIGSYRPFHNLQVWDIRQLNAPVMTTDVGWNRVAAPSKGLGKWKLAKARFVNVCNVLACQWNGDELIAGGTGRTANEVKLFRNEGTSEEPSYQPYKVFKAPPGLLGLPSGVLGFHYSSKKDLLAVATKTGKVFGVQVGNK